MNEFLCCDIRRIKSWLLVKRAVFHNPSNYVHLLSLKTPQGKNILKKPTKMCFVKFSGISGAMAH